jgi:hypothetical protein
MSNIENKNTNTNKDVIYDENNGLYYTKVGDYYYPNIAVENTEKVTLGKYGRARLRYLKEHKKGFYTELLMTGKLTEHLKEIDLNAEQKVKNIINNMAKKDDIPVYYDGKIEQLEWVKLMNNYKNIAEEIVNNELIFC